MMNRSAWILMSVATFSFVGSGDAFGEEVASEASPDNPRPAAPLPDFPPEGGVEGCPGPGALGKIPLDLRAGRETYWTEGDGIDPGTPGYHEEWTNNTYTVRLPARRFGESCHQGSTDRLVETDPDPAGARHPHVNDVGKPCVYSCSAWCQGDPRNADGGFCEGGITVTTGSGDVTSAQCTCYWEHPDVCCEVMAGFSFMSSEECDAIDGSINHGTNYEPCLEAVPEDRQAVRFQTRVK